MRMQTNPPIQAQTDTPEGLLSASSSGEVFMSTKIRPDRQNQNIKTSATS